MTKETKTIKLVVALLDKGLVQEEFTDSVVVFSLQKSPRNPTLLRIIQ